MAGGSPRLVDLRRLARTPNVLSECSGCSRLFHSGRAVRGEKAAGRKSCSQPFKLSSVEM